jgi:hypothetical protein
MPSTFLNLEGARTGLSRSSDATDYLDSNANADSFARENLLFFWRIRAARNGSSPASASESPVRLPCLRAVSRPGSVSSVCLMAIDMLAMPRKKSMYVIDYMRLAALVIGISRGLDKNRLGE